MHLKVSDEDAAEFLQSQFSNELQPFRAGQCTYGLWLNTKGKVCADSFVLCEGERGPFTLLSYDCESGVLAEKLGQHIIADEVVIEEMATISGLSVFGPDAGAVLTALNLDLPRVGTFKRRGALLLFCGRRQRGPSFEIVGAEDALEVVEEKLRAQEVKFLSKNEVEIERIRAGFAKIPEEIDAQALPGEGGLEGDAVSFTKGCFLGQEVVARMHHLGRPQRSLFAVFGKGSPPECPTEVVDEGRKRVGLLKTAFARSEGEWGGAALLKTRHAVPEAVLKAGGALIQVDYDFKSKGEAEK